MSELVSVCVCVINSNDCDRKRQPAGPAGTLRARRYLDLYHDCILYCTLESPWI